MGDQLRKLAEKLRADADRLEQNKTVKCAQIIRGALGLRLLQRKIGRK
jgi:hypothetical protein